MSAAFGLHEMRGEALAALDHLVGRGAQRAAADHHAARGIGAAADRDLVGIGLRQMDLVLGHAEPVGDHLGIGRLVPLAVRQGAGEDRQLARWVEAHLHALVEDAGIVDVIDDAAAAVFAGGVLLRVARGIAVPVGERLAFGQCRGVVPGVVNPAGARLIGEGVGADQVLAGATRPGRCASRAPPGRRGAP